MRGLWFALDTTLIQTIGFGLINTSQYVYQSHVFLKKKKKKIVAISGEERFEPESSFYKRRPMNYKTLDINFQ